MNGHTLETGPSAQIEYIYINTVNLVFDWCYPIMCVYILIIQEDTHIGAQMPVHICSI